MKYKDVTIKGSHFPDDPIKKVKVTFSPEMLNEYIPVMNQLEGTKGMKLLCIIQAQKEGFYKGTRSYRTHNPGNIGNTDSGQNRSLKCLKDGILLQMSYVQRICDGQSKTYPMGKKITIKPFYSKEIADNQRTYGISPYLPGYEFTFTGQLDQYVKIYSTGARAGNKYLSLIISFFANHGITITPETTLQEIIAIQ